MSSSFGFDFGKVRIHTDEAAQAMSEHLGAQAFTYNGEIYFNNGKFQPSSKEGKWLLAHELTHVLQQKGNGPGPVQKKDVPGITANVPDDFAVNKEKEKVTSAEGEINGVKVVIEPDSRGPVPPGASAETTIDLRYSLPGMDHKNGKVSKVNGSATVVVSFRTQYLPDVSPEATSGYGRGTTADDKKSGHTTLKFHEASHSAEAIAYLHEHPLPQFSARVGMTVAEFNKAKNEFIKHITVYREKMINANKQAVDCAGKPASFCKP
jgi:hypothetical protein